MLVMILKPYERFHTGRFSHGPKKSVVWTRLNHQFLKEKYTQFHLTVKMKD